MHNVTPNPSAHKQLHRTERRKHPRTQSDIGCTVITRSGVHHYRVANLSVCGALITDGPELPIGRKVRVQLHIPLYPAIEVFARICRQDRGSADSTMMGLTFVHDTDVTEDLG
jgi:hypothetical protein